MAGDTQRQNLTASPVVMGAALLAAMVPVYGLVFIVPCLVSANRAGTKRWPYVLAAVLCVGLFLLPFAAQQMIQPAGGVHSV